MAQVGGQASVTSLQAPDVLHVWICSEKGGKSDQSGIGRLKMSFNLLFSSRERGERAKILHVESPV